MRQGLYAVLDVNEHTAVLAGPHTELLQVPRVLLPADVQPDALVRLYASRVQTPPLLFGDGHEMPPPSPIDDTDAAERGSRLLRWLDEDEPGQTDDL